MFHCCFISAIIVVLFFTITHSLTHTHLLESGSFTFYTFFTFCTFHFTVKVIIMLWNGFVLLIFYAFNEYFAQNKLLTWWLYNDGISGPANNSANLLHNYFTRCPWVRSASSTRRLKCMLNKTAMSKLTEIYYAQNYVRRTKYINFKSSNKKDINRATKRKTINNSKSSQRRSK